MAGFISSTDGVNMAGSFRLSGENPGPFNIKLTDKIERKEPFLAPS